MNNNDRRRNEKRDFNRAPRRDYDRAPRAEVEENEKDSEFGAGTPACVAAAGVGVCRFDGGCCGAGSLRFL